MHQAEFRLRTPCPAVLLLHELPDGTRHVDWMLATGPDGPLVTFRLAGRPDRLPAGTPADALRLPDHRRDYLDYQGRVSGGRGQVLRLARGTIDEACWSRGELDLRIRWDVGPVQSLHLSPPAPAPAPAPAPGTAPAPGPGTAATSFAPSWRLTARSSLG